MHYGKTHTSIKLFLSFLCNPYGKIHSGINHAEVHPDYPEAILACQKNQKVMQNDTTETSWLTGQQCSGIPKCGRSPRLWYFVFWHIHTESNRVESDSKTDWLLGTALKCRIVQMKNPWSGDVTGTNVSANAALKTSLLVETLAPATPSAQEFTSSSLHILLNCCLVLIYTVQMCHARGLFNSCKLEVPDQSFSQTIVFQLGTHHICPMGFLCKLAHLQQISLLDLHTWLHVNSGSLLWRQLFIFMHIYRLHQWAQLPPRTCTCCSTQTFDLYTDLYTWSNARVEAKTSAFIESVFFFFFSLLHFFFVSWLNNNKVMNFCIFFI